MQGLWSAIVVILIGLGSNLATWAGPPRETLLAAIEELRDRGIGIVKLSPLYASTPIGPSDQPWFVNAVAALDCELAPELLLRDLQTAERAFGRQRTGRWQARPLDLDLLDWHGQLRPDAASWSGFIDGRIPPQHLVLPHPRLHLRRFVLQPLQDIAAGWRHPVLKLDAASLLAGLEDQRIERL